MMSNTPETEVLRIEGNLVISKEIHGKFRFEFINLLSKLNIEWVGSIVPQDDETGMRLYPVEVVESYQRLNRDYELQIIQLRQTKSENDKAFLSLSEELTKKREMADDAKSEATYLQNKLENCQWKLDRHLEYNDVLRDQIAEKDLIIKSLRNKETRWRTFTKWWKELWH